METGKPTNLAQFLANSGLVPAHVLAQMQQLGTEIGRLTPFASTATTCQFNVRRPFERRANIAVIQAPATQQREEPAATSMTQQRLFLSHSEVTLDP